MSKPARPKTRSPAKKSRSTWLSSPLVFIFIFVLAFTLRFIFVLEWEGLPYGKVPLLDAASYDAWAKTIADGNLFRAKAFYQSPLYPYLLAAFYRLFGSDLLVAGLLNTFLGAAAVTFLSACASKIFGKTEALLTGILAAFYQPMIFYAVPLMKESAGLFLLAAFLYFALGALDKKRMRDFILSGVFLGFSVLVRGNAVFLLPAFLGIAWHRQHRKALKNCAVFIIVFCLCLLPSALHNYVVSGGLIPISYADGFNLYIGNSPVANGTSNYPPDVSTNPAQEEMDTTRIAREKTGEDLTPAGVSAFWRMQAFDFMLQNPVKELALARNKFAAFWSNDEAFDNHNVAFIRDNFDTVLRISLPWFGALSCLAAFTVVAAWREKKYKNIFVLATFALAYMASLLVFYVTDRYRLPVVVFLLPLAGAALPKGLSLLRKKDFYHMAAGLLAAACFLLLAHNPLPSRSVSPPAFNWGLLTVMYADSGQNREAVDALHKALALSPQDAGFLPIDKGAEAEQRLGNEAEAVRLYKMAIELFPKASGAWYYYGFMNENKGDLEKALAAYRKAAEVGPGYANNYVGMARIYEKRGDAKRATEMMTKAQEL